MDDFYVTSDRFGNLDEQVAELKSIVAAHQRELDLEEEDESQNATSIDDISGELGNGSSKPDDAKSRNSHQQLRSDPDLVDN